MLFCVDWWNARWFEHDFRPSNFAQNSVVEVPLLAQKVFLLSPPAFCSVAVLNLQARHCSLSLSFWSLILWVWICDRLAEVAGVTGWSCWGDWQPALLGWLAAWLKLLGWLADVAGVTGWCCWGDWQPGWSCWGDWQPGWSCWGDWQPGWCCWGDWQPVTLFFAKSGNLWLGAGAMHTIVRCLSLAALQCCYTVSPALRNHFSVSRDRNTSPVCPTVPMCECWQDTWAASL